MTAACLTGQAWIALKREQYNLAIKLALEALSIVDKSNDELKITILNCLGGVYLKLKNFPKAIEYYTQAYNLSKPTDDKIVNNNYSGPCIPIDKYAMYDNYRNISSINIACIHKKNGDIQLAWNMYKEAIDCEMRDTNDFHCHTCMTIAEFGTHEMIITQEEKTRAWKNWENFLDLGLVDILKYRTSVVTGYLSFNHQYDFPSHRYNNNYCRTMTINYFRKVEKQCVPYTSNHEYYLYTLQCYERLAELYRDWNNRFIDYYEKMIELCLKYHPDDLENIIISYKGYDKWIDPRLKNESDLQKKIIYCHMKLAALFYEQKKVSDAKDSLIKTNLLCQKFSSEMFDVRHICDENLSLINMNFDFTIQSYKNRLSTTITNITGNCIDEDNYCYIAQLYEKKNDLNSAFKFLQKPIEYFEQYDYICLHTIDCYRKLAKHYQIIKNDKESTVNTYERAINFVWKHQSYPMTIIISIIEKYLIHYLKKINDLDTTILIYEIFCEIVQYEIINITILYNHLKRILKLIVHKSDAFNVVLDVYESFLNLILKIINPLTSQRTMVLIHFRDHSIVTYKKFNYLCSAIEIYQKLIDLLFKHQNDTMKIINEYKIIAATL
ncbi:unnamed protein product [Rotaria sordida]|uniref:Uncharacterized protein n=3 Tax=Rotaria sordida TaxID=392033 RepID=A0A814YQK9_9BILA|nr:unnamed protein product [Rotaria sordida]